MLLTRFSSVRFAEPNKIHYNNLFITKKRYLYVSVLERLICDVFFLFLYSIKKKYLYTARTYQIKK